MRVDGRSRIAVLVTWCVLVASIAGAIADVGAQSVGSMRWGFDGRVVPGRFSPLTIEVVNESTSAFDGAAVVERLDGVGSRLGARLVESCYLAPGSRRWLQFDCYVQDSSDEWQVRLEARRRVFDVKTVPSPPLGRRTTVFLVPEDRGTVTGPLRELRSFPAERFPATSAAAESLAAVVIDRVPTWEKVRRAAFVDWLRAGGVVHVLLDGTRAPDFESAGELRVLAAAGPVGAGRVEHHAVTADGVTPALVGRLRQGGALEASIYDPAGQVLPLLQSSVQPDHAWGAIFFVGLLFLLFVGPLHYAWTSKRLAWHVSIALLVVGIVGFTWTFRALGARGYGEAATVTSVSYARQLDDDRWDVRQYGNLFVTAGDVYSLRHDVPSALYATAAQFESVRGSVYGGAEARLRVDVPSFSSRPFVHRAVHSFEFGDLEVEGALGATDGEAFAVTVPESIRAGWVTGVAIQGDSYATLDLRRDGRLVATDLRRSGVRGWLRSLADINEFSHVWGVFQVDGPDRLEPQLRDRWNVLLADALDTHVADRPSVLREDRALQLLLFVRDDRPFGASLPGAGFNHHGFVIYHLLHDEASPR